MLSHPTAAISIECGARLITGMRTILEPVRLGRRDDDARLPHSLFATGDEAEEGLAPKERNRLDGEWFDESRLHGVTTQTEEGDGDFQWH